VYVAGRDRPLGSSPDQDFASLQDDVKFTELIADAAGRLRELWRLQRQQAALAQFLSPMVLDRVGIDDPQQAFAPREAEISVLFCDLRGFSRESERSARDLMKLLERVSGALGVMTRHILTRGGVVGDFHGDAAMGFWGWPLDQPDRVQRACEAALAISADFARAAKHQDHPLAGFQIGIGIATGRAVAGKIGTAEQVKITVFGPVVNLAARLQDLTKNLRAPILVDEPTADAIGELLSPGVARVRRVARLRPRGLDTPLTVSQLLPPEGEGPLTNEQIAIYERALSALNAGDFEQSYALLHQVPADDRVKDFLTVFIAQHNRQPPVGWDGVIDWDGPVLRYSG
jgi:adenylate cyclase